MNMSNSVPQLNHIYLNRLYIGSYMISFQKMRGTTPKLKLVTKTLIRIFTSGKLNCYQLRIDDEMGELPEDVKEGHFAVHTVDDNGGVQRFVIDLRYLTHPGFLELLENAAEEFGFKQDGVLAVPCHPSDLGRILESAKREENHLIEFAASNRRLCLIFP